MSLWLPPTSAKQPDVTLIGWAIFMVMVPKIGKRTVHFAGCSECGGEGRVSSPIEKLDPKNKSGVSSTGRVYRLKGPPGLGSDAQYVWDRWLSISSASVLADVSREVLSQFLRDSANE